MKNFKIVAVILSLVLAVSALAACSGDNDGSTDAASNASNASTEAAATEGDSTPTLSPPRLRLPTLSPLRLSPSPSPSPLLNNQGFIATKSTTGVSSVVLFYVLGSRAKREGCAGKAPETEPGENHR